MRFTDCASVLVLTLAQSALPPLPQLALDSYPATARQAIVQPYKEAAARPNDAQAVGALGRALQAWDQWGSAHEAYLRAQALAPSTFDWHYLDAVVLQRLARPADAVARLRQALHLKPDYLPARVTLAEALLETGAAPDVEASAGMFTELAGQPAATPAAELGLGRIDALRGRHEPAIAHFERAVALYPEWGAAYYALAMSYRAVGRRDEAQHALDRHRQYGPRWPAIEDPVLRAVAALRDDAQARLQQGLKLAESGDTAGSIAAHEAALAIDPSIAQAHANLIQLYAGQKNWAKAEEHYRAVVALGVNLGDAYYDHGVLLGMQEQWDAAAAAYRQAIAVNPRHAPAYNNLGQVMEVKRDIGAAIEAYSKAIENQPTFRLAHFNLGRMLLARGQAAEAIRELEKITEPRDAEAPRYLFALATAHVHAGHKDEGLTWATEAMKLAREYGQTELAAAIERELSRLK